jgi:hypothetical protein
MTAPAAAASATGRRLAARAGGAATTAGLPKALATQSTATTVRRRDGERDHTAEDHEEDR